jgi:uncharacterized membrane protein
VKTKSEVNQFVAREDVGFVLEPAVKALLAHGMTPEQVLGAVTESAKRVIRLSLSDAGEELSVAELDAESDRAAKMLVDDMVQKVRGKAA